MGAFAMPPFGTGALPGEAAIARPARLWHSAHVASRTPLPDAQDSVPILPWRLVAGAFIHFVLPFYLVAAVMAVLLHGAADARDALRDALRISPALLGGYGAVAVIATGAAAILDPLLRARHRRRAARHPRAAALQSERALASATVAARTLPDPSAQGALAALRSARWDHDDPRQQVLARDLAQAVETSARALRSASADRREAIVAMATAAIERIVAAQAELAAADAREDERQARIIAGYVENRYGTSSLSG